MYASQHLAIPSSRYANPPSLESAQNTQKANASSLYFDNDGYGDLINRNITSLEIEVSNLNGEKCKNFVKEKLYKSEFDIIETQKEALGKIFLAIKEAVFSDGCSKEERKNALEKIATQIKGLNSEIWIKPFNGHVERKDIVAVLVTVVICLWRPLISVGALKENNPIQVGVPFLISLFAMSVFTSDYIRAQFYKIKFGDLAALSEIHERTLKVIDIADDILQNGSSTSELNRMPSVRVRKQNMVVNEGGRNRLSTEIYNMSSASSSAVYNMSASAQGEISSYA